MRSYLAALVLVLAASVSVCGQTSGPSISIENTSRDAGTISQGEMIRQVFQFANKGDRTLEILDVAHS